MVVSRETRIGQVFVELTDTLTDDFDVVDLMYQLADACLELLEVDMAGLILVDRRGRPRLVASSPEGMRELELFELQADQGPCLDVLRSGQPVVNVALAQAQQRWPQFTSLALETGVRSTHALPMKLRQDLIGTLSLFTRNEQHLSDGDVALGQALADVASIALLQQHATREPADLAEALQSTLNARVVIGQAKGILAEHSGLHPADTFRFLRAHARKTGEPLQRVADHVVNGQLSSVDLLPTATDTEDTRQPS